MKKYFTVFVVITLILISINVAYSQFSGSGGDQRTQSYIKINGLEYLPPLSTDMPLNCMIGYIVLDSVSRIVDTDVSENAGMNADLESLKTSMSYIYSMVDYSPNLFRQYLYSTRDSTPGRRYRSYPATFYSGIEKAVRSRAQEVGYVYAMLTYTDYIFRISVDTVVKGIDNTIPNNPLPWVNVSCSIKEKIKGKRVPYNCNYIDNRDQKADPEIVNPSCFNFGYPLDWNTATGCAYDDRERATTSKIRTAAPREEYFVFLRQVSLWNYADFVLPVNEFDINGGMFRIKDGCVEDPSNIFGLGPKPKVEQFYLKLKSNINTLVSWGVK